MKFKNLLSYEWDAIAGVFAAVVAIILHLLHVVDEDIILPIVLALMGLLFINFMRHTRQNEITAEQVEQTAATVNKIETSIKPSEIVLIGPRQLRTVNEGFFHSMSGDVVLYNVCLSMYMTPPLFNALLRSLIDNPAVSSIQFVLDESQKALWCDAVEPQIKECANAIKVREPCWCQLDKTISFIMGENQHNKATEALLSFWGEPFMAQATGHDVPRYIFHVQKNSELLPHFEKLVWQCRHH